MEFVREMKGLIGVSNTLKSETKTESSSRSLIKPRSMTVATPADTSNNVVLSRVAKKGAVLLRAAVVLEVAVVLAVAVVFEFATGRDVFKTSIVKVSYGFSGSTPP